MREIHDEVPKQGWMEDEGAMRLRSRALASANGEASPRKRRYAEAVSEDSEGIKPKIFGTKLEKDTKFWFPDGNLVLEAGSVTFKVYGGLLTTQSEVFERLLSDAQAKRAEMDANPFVNNCPTIQLDDHPDDLRYLLRGVFFSSSLFNSASEAMQFPAVAALVQLGHKYRIQHVLNEGIRRMSSCFSDKLDVWDAVNKNMGSALMTYASTDAIAVVNIARLTGTHSMLPVALYLCCQLDIDTILNGAPGPHADGSRVCLSPDDVARCIEQRGTLLHHNVISALRIWKSTPSEKCEARETRDCVGELERVTREWIDYDTGDCLNHPDALGGWVEFFQEADFSLCVPCCEMIQKRVTEERRAIWERLPRLFGVSPRPGSGPQA